MAGVADTTTTSTNAPVKDKIRSVQNARGKLKAAKAKIMLHEGTIKGKPITDQQRKFFGWVAGGRK